MQAACAFG